MKRILFVVFVAVPICGYKWVKILLGRYDADNNPDNDDKQLLDDNVWGLYDPRLEAIWARIWHPPSPSRGFMHYATDYLVEWAKLSGQRTAKAWAMVTLIVALPWVMAIGWGVSSLAKALF